MGFPIPVWKQKVKELKAIAKPPPPPSIPKPKPIPKTSVARAIKEVQQIQKQPSSKPAPVPYKPDAPYVPPKETLTPKEYYQEQKAQETTIETKIKETQLPPKDLFAAIRQERFFPGQTTRYKQELESTLIQQRRTTETARRGITEWHPETRVIKTHEGYRIDFPYAGAEQYGTYTKMYQKEKGKLLFATALTGGDPLGIPSAYYMATGKKQKAFDIKVKALAATRSQSFFQHYISMPTTQIGLAAAGGIGMGSVTSAGYLAGTAAKVGMVVLGGTMIGMGASRPVGMALTGKPGEALGSAATLGFTLGAGYAGFRYGQTVKPVPVKVSKLYKSYKFHKAMRTGKGLYKESELVDIYDTGKPWEPLPFKGEKFSVKGYDYKITGKEPLGTVTVKGQPRYSDLPKTTGWQKPHEGYLARGAYDTHVTKTTGWKPYLKGRGYLESDMPKPVGFKASGKYLYDVKTGIATRLETTVKPVSPWRFKPVVSGRTIIAKTPSLKTVMIKPITKITPVYKTPSYVPPSTVATGYPKLGYYPTTTGGWASAYGMGVSLSYIESLEEGIQYRSKYWAGVVPIKSVDTKLGTVSILGKGLAVDSMKGLDVIQQPISMSDVTSALASDTAQRQQQRQQQKQDIVYKQITQPIYKTHTVYKTPIVSRVSFKPITPKVPGFGFPSLPGISKRKKKKKDAIEWDKGYRYRKWKTPTMEGMLDIRW